MATNKEKCGYTISTVNMLNQLPCYVYWRDFNNTIIGGNNKTAELAGVLNSKNLECLSDFNAPWAEHAENYKQHDLDIAKGIIYSQLDPVQSSSGFKVLLAIKSPLYDIDGAMIGTVGIGMEVDDKLILSVVNSIDKTSPISKGRSIVVANQSYLNDSAHMKGITQREMEVIYYLLRGKLLKEISYIMNISTTTIENHINKIKVKFDCHCKSELIGKLVHLGFMRLIPESLVRCV